MKPLDIISHPLAGVVASVVAYLVAFCLVGGFLSHYLFVWFDYASTAAFSKTVLCDIYAVVAVGLLAAVGIQRANFVEAICAGALLGVAAGGIYCIGYVFMAVPILIAVAAIVVLMVFRLGVVRSIYLGLGLGMTVSFIMFAYSAVSMTQLKSLSGVSSSSITTVTNYTWAAMSASQRESFLSYVAAKEANSLGIDTIAISECILPEDVVATVDGNGRILINYAAVRVASPSESQVKSYIQRNMDPTQSADSEENKSVTWIYESLTSAKHLVVPVCHAVGHIYEQLRVDGSLSASPNWPSEDGDEANGSNPTLEEWRSQLPVDPRQDIETNSSSLETQAWNYGYACVGTYVKATS